MVAFARQYDSFDQSWTLDGLGNFSTFNDDGTSQNRTVNAANEIPASAAHGKTRLTTPPAT